MVFWNRGYWCELAVFNLCGRVDIEIIVTNNNKYNMCVWTCPFHGLFNIHGFCSNGLFVGEVAV